MASMVLNVFDVSGHHARWLESSRWRLHSAQSTSVHPSVRQPANLFLVPGIGVQEEKIIEL
eukprot:scaffold179482_cov40-Tisochrysis_lutea.AAC.1